QLLVKIVEPSPMLLDYGRWSALNESVVLQFSFNGSRFGFNLGNFLAQSLPLARLRSEEHTSELQSLTNLVCRLLLEKKKKIDFANNAQAKMRSFRSATHAQSSTLLYCCSILHNRSCESCVPCGHVVRAVHAVGCVAC